MNSGSFIYNRATMTVIIRSAAQTDQPVITAFIRQARINPRNIDWQRFLVAEENGQVLGMRQVKIHAGGTREVASGFVLPQHRGRGISAQLMNEILKREKGVLFLLCNRKWSGYYEGFGFKVVPPTSLPADLRREYWIAKAITSVLSVFAAGGLRIIPMKRDVPS